MEFLLPNNTFSGSRDSLQARVLWTLQSFDQLDTTTLFELLKLRIDIFVVEQQCVYPELDEFDRAETTLHLLGTLPCEEGGRWLVGCARLLRPASGIAKIGRVAIHDSARGRGYARELMQFLLQHTKLITPAVHVVELSAQVHAQGFYKSLGFEVTGGEYQEDGIPHVPMRRRVGA